MDIRPINPQSLDELASVLELFRVVYRTDLSAAAYRWRFLDNPFGAPLVTLLWDGATLVGHYAASPMRAWVGGEIAAAQSMTTMTHPSYRNRGVFTALAEDLYARMEQQGIELIWGFPNTQSHYGFVNKLGWRDIALVFTMTRLVTGADRAGAGAIEELAGVPGGVTALFERSQDGCALAAMRDERYLRWRYVENPLAKYVFLTLPGGASDVLVVAKEYVPAPNTRALEIVDYLHARAPERFGALLHDVLGWAYDHGYAMVRTWMSLADPAFGQLEKLGFVPKEPLAYFGGRTFGGFAMPESAWSAAGFSLRMGDSDNY